MKKTIWRPLLLGLVLGLLDFVSLAVDFLVPLGPYGATGPQEVFITMSAALGGPLGALITCLFQELGVYLFFLKSQFPPDQLLTTGVAFAAADFSAHLLASLVLAFCYRFLHQRAKQAIFFAGWVLIIVSYYILLVRLQSWLIGLVLAERHPLSESIQNNLPEFLVTLVITTLIWIALPRRHSAPLWHEVQPAAPPAEDRTQPKVTSK